MFQHAESDLSYILEAAFSIVFFNIPAVVYLLSIRGIIHFSTSWELHAFNIVGILFLKFFELYFQHPECGILNILGVYIVKASKFC